MNTHFVKLSAKKINSFTICIFSTFTCNMHAFGIDRELCSEFLRKQCVIANLSKGIIKKKFNRAA